MSYSAIILPYFLRHAKRYTKKYPHLRSALLRALSDFDPRLHVHLGPGVYKIRLRTPDIRKGKSGSLRLIVLLIESQHHLVPVCLYFKGDREDIPLKELNDHLESILFELRKQDITLTDEPVAECHLSPERSRRGSKILNKREPSTSSGNMFSLFGDRLLVDQAKAVMK